MSRAEVWLVIAAMALVTFALRASFLLLPERLGTPKSFERALRYVPTAVIAAIVTPAVLQFGSAEGSFDQLVPRLVAAAGAGLIAWRTRSILYTIVVGMLTLWGVRWLLAFVG